MLFNEHGTHFKKASVYFLNNIVLIFKKHQYAF
jgi:hypothetical protein